MRMGDGIRCLEVKFQTAGAVFSCSSRRKHPVLHKSKGNALRAFMLPYSIPL